MNLTPVTPRQLIGLLRLCKASARARLSDVVEEVDVDRAIRLQEYCINQGDFSISTGSPEQVKQQQDKKVDELLWDTVRELSEDWENKIPHRQLVRELINKSGKGKNYCEKWLVEQDSNEQLVLDTVNNYWSVR